jgi:hypothetical protein
VSKAEQPLPKRMRKFVCFHLGDKHAFAPFTGQDYSAWHTFVYALELYGRGDGKGRESAIRIMCDCVYAAQQRQDVQAVFKKTIPGVLEWSLEQRLWYQLSDIVTYPCIDGPRICSHVNSKPSKKRPGWFQCKDPLCKTEWKLDDDGGSVVCPV